MSLISDLQLAQERAATALAAAMLNPKVTYTIDGRSFAWNEWIKMLRETIADLQEQIIRTTGSATLTTQVLA